MRNSPDTGATRPMQYIVAADTGGTFTDVAVYDARTCEVEYGKTLTDYGDLARGVLEGLHATSVDLADTLVFKHGTTLVINTFLQRTGAKTALITTAGFRDMLEIGRGNRPIPFALEYRRDPPLVPRDLRFEVDERIDARGNVIRPLDEAGMAALADRLGELQVEAVAVSFLNAFANPAHEAAAVRLLRERLPHAYVTAGTVLTREWYEFERTSSAAANAYVGLRMGSYIGKFDERLREQRFRGTFYTMGSNGGVLSVARTLEQPVALVESGPIGGCIGAAAYARALGRDKLIAFDMGGTTAKCALVQNGRFDVQPSYYVGGYDRGFPLKTPVLDIVEVGAGGGSIASVDERGRLSVGPRSAGSEPGPVAFGRGGREPTVTDANLALGRIEAGTFMQGKLRLDRDAAILAIRDQVAGPLGFSGAAAVDTAAQGILDLATTAMAGAIKEITVERGHDVREFGLFAFGGGGPLFGSILARELGIAEVIVPPHPGNFSTLGMLIAGARIDLSQTVVVQATGEALHAILRALEELETSARETMQRELGTRKIRFDSAVEMRYRGQKHTVRVPYSRESALEALLKSFEETYRRRYGSLNPNCAVEIIGVRLGAEAEIPRPQIEHLVGSAAAEAPLPAGRRLVHFPAPHGRTETPVWRRKELPVGFELSGPAVIEEYSATTVLLPGDRAKVGRLGEIAIRCDRSNGVPARTTAFGSTGFASGPGTPGPKDYDPITLEVIRHELVSVPNQIDKNITRTAFSPLIYEYKDYAVGIVDPEGRLISQSRGSLAIFVANALGTAVRDGLSVYGAHQLHTGDVVISNHAGTLGQHLNNVVMYTPVRVPDATGGNGRLAAFFCVLMHWIDVGGSIVGSSGSNDTTDVFQEGIQFRTVKLIKRGERMHEMFRMIQYNTRFPEMLMGDVEAQIAGCLIGRDAVAEIIRKYGSDTFHAAVSTLWNRADAQVRAAIRKALPGEYRAHSFLDNDGLLLDETVPVGIRVLVEGERVTVDFSEVSDQRPGPLNAGRNGGAVAAARIAMKYLFSPGEPVNEGDFLALTVKIPEGKFLSARTNAPVAGSGTMIPTVVDTILHAMAAACPDRAAAAHHGTYGIHSFYGISPATGAPFLHNDTWVGGWGATAAMDGYGPSRSNVHGDTSDVPVEMQETFHPYRLEAYRLRTDSGGAGEFRGGLGVEKLYRIIAPCRLTLKIDRTKCPPWGFRGGGAGLPGDLEIRRASGEVLHALKGDHPLFPGDSVRVLSGGGGGYGSPWRRAIARVEEDVRLGYVSMEAARELYGVVMRRDGVADIEATEVRRKSLVEETSL